MAFDLSVRAMEIRPSVQIVDLTNTRSFFLSRETLAFSINASMDNAAITATASFRLGPPETSLSPLMDNSFYNMAGALLRPGQTVVLGLDVTYPGNVAPNIRLFIGRLDRVDAAAEKDVVTIQCRDLGGFYLNTMIQQATKKGTVGGQNAEDVMRAIMVENGFTANGLIVPVSPGFAILEYAQQEVNVLEALRTIAQQIGWDVRWVPSAESPAIPADVGLPILFYDPNRTRGVDLVVPAGRYEAITELAWGDEDVRNSWDVFWQGVDGQVHGPIHVEDATSIAKYGLRYTRIYLNRADNIRSDVAATNFAIAALTDSKDPFASHSIRAPLLPMVELNDLHQYQADGLHYDTDQILAVVAYRHEYRNGHATTTIGARGKPIAAYRDYRRSRPPPTIVSTLPPSDLIYAPENTIHLQVDSFAFP